MTGSNKFLHNKLTSCFVLQPCSTQPCVTTLRNLKFLLRVRRGIVFQFAVFSSSEIRIPDVKTLQLPLKRVHSSRGARSIFDSVFCAHCFSSSSPPEASATVGRTSWPFICTRCRLTRPLVKNTQPWWSVSSFRESQKAGNFVVLCVFTLSPQHRPQSEVWTPCCRIHTGLLPWAEVKSGHTGEHSAEGKLGWHWQSICEWVKAGSCQVWRLSTYNPSNCSNKAGGLPLVWRQPALSVVKGLMWVLETVLNSLPEQCGFSSH